MKKKALKLFSAVLATAALVALVACDTGSSASEDASSSALGSASSSATTGVKNSLNEMAINATGIAEVEIDGEVLLRAGDASTTLGGSGLQQLTIKGKDADAAVTTAGTGNGAVCAANGGLLVFKDLTIDNNSGTNGNWTDWALEFSGKLRFENCTFEDCILLKNDAQAEFINCKFTSTGTKKYAVWMLDGGAKFTGCTFEGFRGLKLHEEGGTDVTSVVLDDCDFVELAQKPGIAVGNVDATTVLTVKNSRFTGCQPWDYEGSKEGIDGFYEADTLTEDFAFTEENNEVNGVPSSSLTKEFSE